MTSLPLAALQPRPQWGGDQPRRTMPSPIVRGAIVRGSQERGLGNRGTTRAKVPNIVRLSFICIPHCWPKPHAPNIQPMQYTFCPSASVCVRRAPDTTEASGTTPPAFPRFLHSHGRKRKSDYRRGCRRSASQGRCSHMTEHLRAIQRGRQRRHEGNAGAIWHGLDWVSLKRRGSTVNATPRFL